MQSTVSKRARTCSVHVPERYVERMLLSPLVWVCALLKCTVLCDALKIGGLGEPGPTIIRRRWFPFAELGSPSQSWPSPHSLVLLPCFLPQTYLGGSEGGFGYDSTDMAAVQYRLKTLKCNWIIAITDAGQVN